MKQIIFKTGMCLLGFGLFTLVISSCSNYLSMRIEKRKYNDGFYVNVKTPSKINEIINQKSKRDEKSIEQVCKEKQNLTVFYADAIGANPFDVRINNNIIELPVKNDLQKPLIIENTNKKTDRGLQKNFELKRKPLLKSNSSKNIKDNGPCPKPGKGLIIAGIIMMLIGLILLAVPEMVVILIGLGLGTIGLLIFYIGYLMPSPQVTSIENLPFEMPVSNVSSLYIPSFDFKPIADANSKSTISLILLNPKYARDFEYMGISLFNDFASRMRNDFDELLNVRGFTMRKGNVSKYDDLVYNDKAYTDLLVEIDIDIKFNRQNLKSTMSQAPVYALEHWSCGKTRKVQTGMANLYSFSGDINVQGEINIKISEVMTQEKVWTKSVELSRQQINIKTEKLYESQSVTFDKLLEDPGVNNPVSKLLENYYQTAMQKAWNYLDPRELEILKPQIELIRSKSGYGRKVSE